MTKKHKQNENEIFVRMMTQQWRKRKKNGKMKRGTNNRK